MQETGRNKPIIRQTLTGNIFQCQSHLMADNICVHHLFQALSGGFFTLGFGRFKNCFKDPDDMYSVMNIT